MTRIEHVTFCLLRPHGVHDSKKLDEMHKNDVILVQHRIQKMSKHRMEQR